MEKTKPFECVDYICPEAGVFDIDCNCALCQSGEVPDMNEGWTFNL